MVLVLLFPNSLLFYFWMEILSGLIFPFCPAKNNSDKSIVLTPISGIPDPFKMSFLLVAGGFIP